jgi:6-phosphofructokinase 2
MPTIITITFSPCIDKSTSVTALISEKKMRCTLPKLEPGGGGVNVARVLKRLSCAATAIFPSGGYTGMFFNHLLQNEKVSFVPIKTKNETRENFVVLDESTNMQFRFGMPSNKIIESEWQNMLKTIENFKNVSYIILSGSLPERIPLIFFATLANIAKLKNAKLIVDTSGLALKHAVNKGVYLVKPNLEELGILLKNKKIKIDNIEIAAKELIKRKNCEIVVVSLGANGAMLVSNKETVTIKPPKVKIKSTVGAGDSMVAGIVYGLSKKLTLTECLQYGIACGTATTMNFGTALCKKSEVEKLLKILKK